MQGLFNCCAALDSWPREGAAWCSVDPLVNSPGDEEVVGNEVYMQRSVTDARRPVAAPLHVGGVSAREDEKETAKQRLQRLIRDFAHDAVGTGMAIEVVAENCDPDIQVPTVVQEALLRMDRRLSCLEVWFTDHDGLPPGRGSTASLKVPLELVSSISKGHFSKEEVASGKANELMDSGTQKAPPECALTVMQMDTLKLRLFFDTPTARDRAYTCLRIFQMSVDRRSDKLEGAEDL